MNKFGLYIKITAALHLMSFVLLSSVYGDNLVGNGNFEDHVTEDLRVFDGPWRSNKIQWEKDGTGTAIASEEAAYEGVYGFFFKRDASDQQQNNITVWQDMPAEAGKTYTFSFMAQLQNTEENVLRFAVKKMVDDAPVDVFLWEPDTLIVDEYTSWNKYEGNITIPDNASGVRLILFRNPGGDSCFVDNVSLLEYVPETETGLVGNGHFEDNVTEDLRVFDGPWRNNKIQWEKDGTGTAIASEEAAYEGVYGFFFKRDASDQQQNNITVWQDMPAEAGKTYTFSFMAQLQNTEENVLRFAVKKMVDDAPVDVFLWEPDTLIVDEYTSWNKYEGNITIPDNASGVRLILFRNPGGDSCFVDNVSLLEYVPETETGLVGNGHFEDNVTEDLRVFDGPWRNNKIQWEKDGAGTAIASEDAAYEGAYGFFFKRDASEEQKNSITVWQDIPVEAGETYTFSFMAQLQNTADNVLRFGVKKMVDGAPVDVFLWDLDTLEVDEYINWNKYEGNITIPDNASGVRLTFFRNPGGDSCFIDNVSLNILDKEPQAYYVSSSEGNDSNDGLSPQTAWQSLEKVNQSFFVPGDSILFKTDDEFIGQLRVNNSGKPGQKIVISKYGEGDKPHLNGSGAEGGDFADVIYVENQSYIEISSLQISNNRFVPRADNKDTRSYGVHVRVNGPESQTHFRIKDLTIMDIYPVTNEGVDFQYVDVAGVYFYTTENWPANPKHMSDIIVEDCYITRTGKFGIWVKHNGIVEEGVGNDTINKNMDIIIRNNHMFETGGSGITVSRAYNCLVENNLIDYSGFSGPDERLVGRGSGIWFYATYNGISQYNSIYHPRGENDSYGQHIDFKNKDVIVQYNYSEDSEGGFMQILGDNIKSTYRFNVSVNDGFRKGGSDKLDGNSLKISDHSEPVRVVSDSNFVYNNTIFVDANIKPGIYIEGTNTIIYNNIFQAFDDGSIGRTTNIVERKGGGISISHNLFDGEVHRSFRNTDKNGILGDPNHKNPRGSGKEHYALNEPSYAVYAGLSFKEPVFPMAGKGIFKDIPVNPDVDIFGNPIDIENIRPNVGAQAGRDDYAENSRSKFYIEQNPVRDMVMLRIPETQLSDEFNFRIVNLRGEVVQVVASYDTTDNVISFPINKSLPNGIYLLQVNNEKVDYGVKFMFVK
ncbi:carbohydrate binding domain-containing protein [Carboxylicivirga marina]|uniref:Carbohydrate binding domain-containing protein n=1 Tax=Carboxylicivirga marina TaxID=2800988 RepID=A0ABS1HHS7_9BACT|nr:carbohydrate binding domain-containing protein [Carboxylicivirga marina]MBK3517218.1 carbohydrate binding domain-containing protein [Carboxylicivirga marina]